MVVENPQVKPHGKEWKLVGIKRNELIIETWKYKSKGRRYLLHVGYVRRRRKIYPFSIIMFSRKLHVFDSKDEFFKFLEKRKLPKVDLPF